MKKSDITEMLESARRVFKNISDENNPCYKNDEYSCEHNKILEKYSNMLENMVV